MFKTIKESFHITNKYIILATPLILFSLLSSLYLLFSMSGNFWSLIFAVILFFLMTGAFLSGWFYMTKRCVTNPETEDVNGFLTQFPSGVGEYFLPMLGLIVISLGVAVIIFLIAYSIGMKFIGDVGIPSDSFVEAAKSVDALKTFLAGLTTEQVVKLQAWNLLLFGSMVVTYFMLIFYSPSLMFKTKNPFKALWYSWKDLFSRKFFKNVLIFVFVFALYFILSVLSALLGSNIVTHFIFTLVNFYFMVYVVVLLYNYYFSNYIKIGSNIDERV